MSTADQDIRDHNMNLLAEALSSQAKATFDPSKGQKFDADKQSWYPLPLEILKPLADLCKFGASKYACFNMLQPFENADQRFWDGIMRHLAACQMDPLAKDDESECYHLAAVAFNALLRLYHCRKEKDAPSL